MVLLNSSWIELLLLVHMCSRLQKVQELLEHQELLVLIGAPRGLTKVTLVISLLILI